MTPDSPANQPLAAGDAGQRLVDDIAAGEKERAAWRVGTEYEKFGHTHGRLAPLRYRTDDPAEPSIERLLAALRQRASWARPILDGPHVVGLIGQRSSITLEPAGQFELSAAPYATMQETAAALERYEQLLWSTRDELPIHWLFAGHRPVHSLDELDWMPKQRYAIMRRYLPHRGRLARNMMQATATVQANYDFADEADMGVKFRTAMGVSSIVTAMFANSPFVEGRPSGFKSFRARVWRDVDPDRCGLVRWVFEGEPPSYEQWVRHALEVPLFFLVRDGQYVDCAGVPFRELLNGGLEGHRATLADWRQHLSTIFTEVRLKSYLEVRGADCVEPRLIPALPALYKGLLYMRGACDAAWDLVKSWTWDERRQHLHDVSVDALAARTPRGYATAELAQELLRIASFGLAEQAQLMGHEDEGGCLAALAALTDAGLSPADVSLTWFAESTRTRDEILAHYTHEWPGLR